MFLLEALNYFPERISIKYNWLTELAYVTLPYNDSPFR